MKIQDNKGFTLIELLIVIAIIGIIAAIAVPGLLRARVAGNETSAIGSMRAVSSAEATFAATCGGGGYAQTLVNLFTGPAGGIGFISPDLGTDPSIKSGYTVTMGAGTIVTQVTAQAATCNNIGNALASYYVHTEPVGVGSTGQRSFATDHRGTIYQLATGAVIPNTMVGATFLR